jgi:CubicO group peptidase (beta-lactamase class C family)
VTPLRAALLGLAILVSASLAAGVALLASIAPSGTGYEAQTLCSAVFISGRTPESVHEAEFQGLHPLLRLVSLDLDRPHRIVRASLLGLGAQTAVFRPGLGCTLADAGTILPPAPASVTAPRAAADDVISRGVGALPPGVDRARLAAAVDDAFAETNPAEPVRTRALLVLMDGRPIAERYAPGFDKDMPLAGYSMSKTVLGALTGILVARGQLRLDQADLRPEWRSPGDPRLRITVDQLLHMSSGLAWSEESRSPRGDALIMAFHDRDVTALAASRALAHPPGAVYTYSSGATNILSRVLRHALGDDAAAYLALPRTAIFDRIGMSSALITPDASGTLIASTVGFATARDWARFGELYRNDGRWNGEQVLPTGWVAYSARPQAAAGGADYGAMIHLNRGPAGRPQDRPHRLLPSDVLLLTGQFGQVTTIVPSRRLVVVRLGESHGANIGARVDRVVANVLSALQQVK